MSKKAVKPVEEGFHSITPHLVCRNAVAAIDFYKRAFGAEEIMRLVGPDGTLMHGSIKIGNSILMLTDEMPQWGSLSPLSLKGSPVTVHLAVPDVDATFARAIKEGAKSTMPVADQFWGDRYGKLQDPFGHVWSVATHVRDMTHDEIMKAAEEAMKSMANCPEAKAS